MSPRPTTVFINELRVMAIVGIHPDERVAAQPLVIDIELHCDSQRVYASNDIADTIDYAKVARQVTQLVTDAGYRLLEIMAEDIADMLLAKYPAQQVQVQVAKTRALDKAHSAGVRIIRQG